MSCTTPDIPDKFETRSATTVDGAAISRLHARVFGPGRFARTAYRVREGTAVASPYCRLAFEGTELVASVRMTAINVGGLPNALLLGPLAVSQNCANLGLGRRLVAEALAAGKQDGKQLVVLVGDLSYYGRMGFVATEPGQMWFDGPVDAKRLLAAELVSDALAHYAGLITAAA